MSDEWKTYRTRFVVRARQLTEPYTFNDSSGHERHGEPGDYLVQSSDGPRISRREIFEDVYVVLEAAGSVPSPSLGAQVAVTTGEVEAGGHGFSRAGVNGSGIGAVAPAPPVFQPWNLPV